MSRAKESVEAAIRSIREAVRNGRRLHDREFREQAGLPARSVEKRRRFVDPRRGGYSDEELERLYAVMRRHRRVVGLTILDTLVAVAPETRKKLLQEAVAGGWGLRRLQQEMQVRTGRRFAGGGRRPHVPQDADGLLLSLHAQCTAWMHWCDEIRRDVDRDGQPRTPPIETLKASGARVGRRGIVTVVGEIEERVRELREAIEGLQEAGRKK